MDRGSLKVGDLVSPLPGYAYLSPTPSSGWPARIGAIDPEERYFSVEGDAHRFRLAANYGKVAEAVSGTAQVNGMLGTSEPRLKDTNPKTAYGKAKPPIGLLPPVALIEAAEALRHGADNYGPANWREDPVSLSTYRDALYRHFLAFCDGQDIDVGTPEKPGSGASHLGHIIANAAIILDALASGTMIDDRPKPGKAAEWLIKYTKDIKHGPG